MTERVEVGSLFNKAKLLDEYVLFDDKHELYDVGYNRYVYVRYNEKNKRVVLNFSRDLNKIDSGEYVADIMGGKLQILIPYSEIKKHMMDVISAFANNYYILVSNREAYVVSEGKLHSIGEPLSGASIENE